MTNNVIAIDTGANGGISIFKDNEIYCSPYVDIDNLKHFLKEICGKEIVSFKCVIETLNIFTNVSGSKNTVFKQGVSFGECIGMLKGLEVKDIIEVSAKKWQKYLELPKGLDYKDRKILLCSKAEELFPIQMNYKKTKKYKNSICDSLLILNYFINHYE